jgi:hypothetical protein
MTVSRGAGGPPRVYVNYVAGGNKTQCGSFSSAGLSTYE